MKIRYLALMCTLSIGVSACTTVPTANNDFLSRSDRLEAAKGVRSKRLATPAPNPPIAQNVKLKIEAVRFVAGANVSDRITPEERALITNALSRRACNDFSKHFEIVESSSDTAPTYQLRIGVTQLEATNKLGAAIGVATGFISPIGGIRPPIGLGGLTVEFELLAPMGEQAAAMIWSRKADVAASDTSPSRIGDAYLFAAEATSDFENLASRQTQSGGSFGAIKNPFGGKPDAACAAFGTGPSGVSRVAGFMGLPLPPEAVDKGAKAQR